MKPDISMRRAPTVIASAIAAFACAIALFAVAPTGAKADAFGVITHWQAPEFIHDYRGTGFAAEAGGENAVFIADEPIYEESTLEFGIRIRKYAPAGGAPEGEVIVPITYTGTREAIQIAGLTVAEGKVFLLTTDGWEVRSGGTAQQIYAFSTAPDASGKLVPAQGADPTTGVLAGAAVLDEVNFPDGLSFDPATKNLVISGQAPQAVPGLEGPGTAGPFELQSVQLDGQLGPLWVEHPGGPLYTTDEHVAGPLLPLPVVFDPQGIAYLPVALGGSGNGGWTLGMIDDITDPTSAVQAASSVGLGAEADDLSGTQIGGVTGFLESGQGYNVQAENAGWAWQPSPLGFPRSTPSIAIDPAGRIWDSVKVTAQGFGLKAVSTTDGGSFSAPLLGVQRAPGAPGAGLDGSCNTSQSVADVPSIAAAGDGILYTLSPTGKVTEFGLGGGNCVPTVPTALTVNGSATGGTPVSLPRGETATFVAGVEEAEVTSVEWDFGDGTGATTEASESAIGKSLSENHAFDRGGVHTITAKVHTNSLVNPEVFEETAQVEIPFLTPEAVLLSEPGSVKTGESVSFDASGSSNVEPGDTYAWVFGDGAHETTSSPESAHVYTTAGTYTAEVTIENGNGESDTDSATISVTAPPPSEEQHPGGGGDGGSNDGGSNGGGDSTQPAPGPAPTPAPTPKTTPKPKLTPKQKALAKCKKLKGKAKARCVKKANAKGKKAGKAKGKKR